MSHDSSLNGHLVPRPFYNFGGVLVTYATALEADKRLLGAVDVAENAMWHLPASRFFVRAVLPTKIQRLHDWELTIMAKKTANKRGTGTTGNWRGFAEIPVTKEMRADYLKWVKSADLWQLMYQLLQQGYSVKLTFHQERQHFAAAMSCYDETSPNYQHTMMTRAGDAETVLATAIWKHYAVAGEVWSSDEADDDVWG